jgi:hypothetical protein
MHIRSSVDLQIPFRLWRYALLRFFTLSSTVEDLFKNLPRTTGGYACCLLLCKSTLQCFCYLLWSLEGTTHHVKLRKLLVSLKREDEYSLEQVWLTGYNACGNQF